MFFLMPKIERKWHKIYIGLMVSTHLIYISVSVIEWLFIDSGFPIVALVVGIPCRL
ncbi:TPA: hypothetical protein ACWWDF_002787 [Enterococcus faecium]